MQETLYICDYGKTVVRKVNAAGIIITCAGAPGLGGDGPATSAQLNSTENVSVDAADNLYISDAINFWICKISPAGYT